MPLLELTFIHLDGFTRQWRRYRLFDEDLQALESHLVVEPEAGAAMSGTGGLRKVRFAPPSQRRGKSGAYRVCYAYFRFGQTVLLAAVFAKSDKANLSAGEKAEYKKIIAALKPRSS